MALHFVGVILSLPARFFLRTLLSVYVIFDYMSYMTNKLQKLCQRILVVQFIQFAESILLNFFE